MKFTKMQGCGTDYVYVNGFAETVENPAAAAKVLQAQAEGLVEDHKRGLLQSIEELYEMTNMQSEVRGLQNQLTSAQERLTEIRSKHPKLLEEQTHES